jgi:hypothetical protein
LTPGCTAAHTVSAFFAARRQDAARRADARCRELHARGEGGFEPAIEGLEPVTNRRELPARRAVQARDRRQDMP